MCILVLKMGWLNFLIIHTGLVKEFVYVQVFYAFFFFFVFLFYLLGVFVA